ncbi:hypothetical protein AB0F88_40380 [Streptosporangium sp. NPDC023963]|uniref:hypothetical protein n=1 Tax=Streptosporangium sp. NPDC023963 TaxID=3155608 RepID=UPI003422B24F
MNDRSEPLTSTPAPRPDPATRLTRAERRERDAAAKVRAARIADDERRRRRIQAEQDREEQEQRRAAAQLRRTTTRSIRSAAARTRWQARLKKWRDTAVLVGAIVGVNLVAIVGQVAAFHEGFEWSMPVALGAAAVIESIAIYVGWHAHTALIEGDSVVRLRAASYFIALVVGGLNYSHYAGEGGTPTEEAVMFGMASLLSPWLWALHSRHQHRQQLRADGLIDPRAPKFGLRWIFHYRETMSALSWAVGEGVQSPAVAIAAVRAGNAAGNAKDALYAAERALTKVQSDALKLALTHLAAVAHDLDREDPEATEAREGIARFVARFQPLLPPLSLRELVPGDSPAGGNETGTEAGTQQEPKRPSDQDNDEARKFIRDSIRYRKVVPSKGDVAAKFKFSQSWGYDRVVEVREELSAKGWLFPNSGPPVSPSASKQTPARSSEESPSEEPTAVNGATVSSSAVGGDV